MFLKTAKEIALSACPEEVQSKVSEVAVRSGIPDDDPLWLVFLATTRVKTETKLMGALLDKIDALEEGMSLLTEALLENDAAFKDLRLQIEQSNQENQTHTQQAEQARFANLRRWLIASVITVVGLGAVAAVEAVVIAMNRLPTAEESTPVVSDEKEQQHLHQQEQSDFVETETIPLNKLRGNLSPASQKRLEACLNQKAQCTLLIDEPVEEEEFDTFVEEDSEEDAEYEEH